MKQKPKGLDFKVKEEEKQSVFVSMLTTLIPVLIIAFLFIFFLAQGGGGGGRMMNFGKSKAKMYDNQNVVYDSQMSLVQMKKNKNY